MRLFGTMALCGISAMCTAQDGAEVRVRVVPLAESYRQGEPIEVRLAIDNVSRRDVRLQLDYPDHLGVSFECDDASAVAPVDPGLGGRIPVVDIAAGRSYERVFALNRHMRFARPGEFAVRFLAEHHEVVRGADAEPKTWTSRGEFVVRVIAGAVGADTIARYVAALDGPDPVAAERAAEMLLWIDDAATIEPLRRVAGKWSKLAPGVVDALARFHTDAAREAIVEVAKTGDAQALAAALRTFERSGEQLPEGLLEALLASPRPPKLRLSIDYLSRHGGAAHVDLVRPLTGHADAEVARAATEFVRKFQKR
jgi:hypothetical protein